MLGALQALCSTGMTAAVMHKDVKDGNGLAAVILPSLAGKSRGVWCFALVLSTLGLGSPSWLEQERKAGSEGSVHKGNYGRLLSASCFE